MQRLFARKLTSGLSTIKVFSEIVIANGEASFFVKALLVYAIAMDRQQKLQNEKKINEHTL